MIFLLKIFLIHKDYIVSNVILFGKIFINKNRSMIKNFQMNHLQKRESFSETHIHFIFYYCMLNILYLLVMKNTILFR